MIYRITPGCHLSILPVDFIHPFMVIYLLQDDFFNANSKSSPWFGDPSWSRLSLYPPKTYLPPVFVIRTQKPWAFLLGWIQISRSFYLRQKRGSYSIFYSMFYHVLSYFIFSRLGLYTRVLRRLRPQVFSSPLIETYGYVRRIVPTSLHRCLWNRVTETILQPPW